MTWGNNPNLEDAKQQSEATEDQTDNETGMTKEEKEERKKAREQVKYDCLCLANIAADDPEKVVERAKAYYSFVTGKGSRKKEG